MAVVAHLVERTHSEGDNDLRDGVASAIIAIDDAVDTTDLLVQARGATILNANGFDLPATYFNDNTSIAVVFDAADDVFVASGPLVLKAIA